MADRKRPRDDLPDDDANGGAPGTPGRAGGMAGAPASSVAGTPARTTLRRLRQGIAPEREPEAASSLGGSEDEFDEFAREDEEELRRADDVLDAADDNEDEDGEDLFGDSLERDYAPNVRLDTYDQDDLDEQEYDAMSLEERRALEARMSRRDRDEGRRGRLPGAYLESDDQESEATPPIRRRRVPISGEGAMDVDEAEAIIDIETLQDMRGMVLSDYLSQDGIGHYFGQEFKTFLTSFTDEEDVAVYAERIKAMCETNGESLEISYDHLAKSKPVLAYVVSNSPAEALRIFDRFAMDVTLDIFPHYDDIRQEIHVRISDLPEPENLRDLRQTALNRMVRVSGVVTRRTSVFPQLKYVKFDCGKCGATLGPFYQDIMNEIKLNNCPQCQAKGPFNVNSEQTIYRNYQRMTLQETPGSVPAGRLPRTREVILLWDLIDSARPGEEVDVTGIYRNNFNAALNSKNGFPVFATVIEANYISRKEDIHASFRLTEEDEKAIQRMSQDERIGQRIIKSIAPSIFGHEDVKTAIALALFGGVAKNPLNKHRIRGDINVLMLGDPGTAKSQLLKYIENTANRAVYTTGQGASAVGLTASVRKDPLTREWTLEGGALVLADKGVCLIDEFDKMNDQDRTSIHEAMEQQTISISKAGIVTSLQARCTVFAAANPIRGRYDPRIPFNLNVELTEPILSRFDVLCVVQDRADPVVDGMLAEFVLDSHVRSHPKYDSENNTVAREQDSDIIPQDLLKKYIMYAKDRVQPKLGSVDADRLSAVYAELRRASLVGDSIPITVRHLESMIRLSEANARMHLRDEVRTDDVNMAIRVMVDSFVKAQKWSVRRQMQKQFARYINFHRDNDELLNHVLADLVRDHTNYFSFKHGGTQMPERLELDAEDFEARARDLNIFDVAPFYSSKLFVQNRFAYDASRRMIVKAF